MLWRVSISINKSSVDSEGLRSRARASVHAAVQVRAGRYDRICHETEEVTCFSGYTVNISVWTIHKYICISISRYIAIHTINSDMKWLILWYIHTINIWVIPPIPMQLQLEACSWTFCSKQHTWPLISCTCFLKESSRGAVHTCWNRLHNSHADKTTGSPH